MRERLRAVGMMIFALGASGALPGCGGDDTIGLIPEADGGDASILPDATSSSEDASGDGAVDATTASDSGDASSDASDASKAVDASPDADDASLIDASSEAGDASFDPGDASPDAGDASSIDAGDAGIDGGQFLRGAVAIAGTPTSIAPGSTSFCALLTDGSVRCWGNDGYGQTGTGAPAPPFTTTLATEPVGLSSGVALVAVGDTHVAATQQGATLLWGNDTFGQLANGSQAPSYTPAVVPSLAGATSLSLGGEAGCAVLGGEVKCWGANTFGNVGNGTTTAQKSPASIGVTASAVAVSQHTCALTAGGSVSCWGRDDFGQLGRTSSQSCTSALVPCDPRPGATAITSGATSIAVGGAFSCALVALDGGNGVECWGANGNGQLGGGHTDTTVHTAPIRVIGLTAPTQIAAGGKFACALDTDGHVLCWGADTTGQLGNQIRPLAAPPPPPPPTPPVVAVSNAAAVAAGDQSACAVMNDSTVECWGANDQGQLGIGVADQSTHGPTRVLQ